MLRRRASTTTSPSWEDAKFAVQEIGGWVKNADTKITILAGTVGVILSLLLARLADILRVVRVHDGAARDVVLVSGVVGLACLALTVAFSVRALIPRFGGDRMLAATNRFSWPELADDSSSSLPDPATAAMEAWAQARALSRIARAKYRSFRWALGFFLAGATSLVICVAAAAWASIV